MRTLIVPNFFYDEMIKIQDILYNKMVRTINKPKLRLNKLGHARSMGQKKSLRESKTPHTRSSLGRYSDASLTAPRPTDSKSIALYTGEGLQPNNVITNNLLSKKRAKKLDRNQKYINQRNGGDIDMEPKSREVKQSELDQIKAALWNVVENKDIFKLEGDVEGTTLGVQAF